MSLYYIGVSKTFNNVRKRNNPLSQSKPVSMAFYVSESFRVKSKRIKTSTYYLYKYFKPRYKRRIAWCTNCESKFPSLVKNEKVITECPNCEE